MQTVLFQQNFGKSKQKTEGFNKNFRYGCF